jgi:HAD superfamily hydrolase (TIGR01509 family)
VDGTLFDTYPAFVEAFLAALGESGVSTPAPAGVVGALARVGLSHCVRELSSRYGLGPEVYGERFDRAYRAIPTSRQAPFPGVVEVCEAVLAGGGVNVIATHRARASTEGLLSGHRMRHLFVDIASVEDGCPRKPDPAMFLDLLARRRLDPARCVAVGDRDIDVLAGRAAGLRTCLFRGGAEAASRPDFAFDEYLELGRYLGELDVATEMQRNSS